jgi:hypothetical protein
VTAAQPIADSPLRTARTRAFVLQRPNLIAAAVCLMSFAGFWLAQRAAHVSMLDLLVYRAEGWAARNGEGLYDMRVTYARLPATYPPFAALLFMPLTWLEVGQMRDLAVVGNLVLLVTLVHLSLRLLGRPCRLPRVAVSLAVAAVAVWCEPVWTTLRYGQINLLLAVLVLWDLTRRNGHRWAGFGTGLAAGIKLTPALFAVFLALAGIALGWQRLRRGGSAWNVHLRRSAVAAATFAGTVVLTALVLPHDSRRFWTQVVFAADRVGHGEETGNQSLRGFLARALHDAAPGNPWLISAAVAGCAGLAVAVAAQLAGDRLPHASAWAAIACAVTALLISPVSWSHHWVWGVPMVLLLAAEATRRRDARWAAGAVLSGVLFSSYLPWLVPHGGLRPELHQSGGEMLLSAVYPALGAAFLAVAGAVSVRALRGR